MTSMLPLSDTIVAVSKTTQEPAFPPVCDGTLVRRNEAAVGATRTSGLACRQRLGNVLTSCASRRHALCSA